MPLSQTAKWVTAQTTARWWSQDLAGQRHFMLQSYLFLIFLIVGGFCFIQGPTDYLLSNLLALAGLALLYLLYALRILNFLHVLICQGG